MAIRGYFGSSCSKPFVLCFMPMNAELDKAFMDYKLGRASSADVCDSSVGTNPIVGYIWKLVERLDIFPWFDRVDSESNPVDGLSRQDLRGPWQLVDLVFLGSSLRAESGADTE